MTVSSKKPRKQRRWRFTASLHERQRLVHAHLSKEARAKLKTNMRSIAVREGDKVKIMRGKFKGHSGKVSAVDLTSLKVFIEGAVARKARGQEKLVPIEPSNIMIIEPDMSDELRMKLIARNPAKEAKEAKAAPAAKAEATARV